MIETDAERRERESREEQEREDAEARLHEINEKYDECNPWWSR